MSMLFVSVIALTSLVLIDKLALPYLSKKETKTSKEEIIKVSWFAILSLIRKFSLWAFIIYGLLSVFLFFLNSAASLFKNDEEFVNNFLNSIKLFNDSFQFILDQKSYAIFLILGIATILYTFFKVKREVLNIYGSIKSKANEVNENIDSPEIRKINEEMLFAFRDIQNVKESLNIPEKSKESILSKLHEKILNLYSLRDDLLIKNRIIPTIENQKNESNNPSFWSKVFLFFRSKGLVYSTYRLGGFFSNISVILLLLALISGNGSILTDSDKSSKKAYAWYLQTQKNKIDNEWKEKLSGAEINSDWSDEDEEILNEISRSVEVSFAQTFSPIVPNAQHFSSSNTSYEYSTKASAVKYRILKASAEQYTSFSGGKTTFKTFRDGENVDISSDKNAAQRKSYNRLDKANVNFSIFSLC